MSFYTAERLYELLPAIYRLRDAEQGYPLRDLVTLLAREARVVEDDIRQLYENLFIETADEWAVPYIGDLVGVRPLPATGASRRAEVAHTIGYRRRKGTAAVLEQLARDVTGWPAARVVEYFELLATTQHLNHTRPRNLRTPDLRLAGQLELLGGRLNGGPFDGAAHTGEVRRIAPRRGRFNIKNVGLWLWRLDAYPMSEVDARLVADGTGRHFTFSPLGHDAPLFHVPLTETGPEHIAEEIHVPTPIRMRALEADPAPYTGVAGSLRVTRDGAEIAAADLVACNLEGWGRQPPAGKVGVDPVLGRLAFPPGEEPAQGAVVAYAYGFPDELGGGPYPRAESFTTIAGESTFDVGTGQPFASPVAALGAWVAAGRPSAVITIHDSRTYEETPAVTLPANTRLELRAADGERPVLLLGGDLAVSGGSGSAFEINGLVIGGGRLVAGGRLDRLTLRHVTLVPGRGFDALGQPTDPGATSLVLSSPELEAVLELSLLGPIEAADEVEMTLSDCLIDAGDITAPAFAGLAAGDFGGPLVVSRCTVVGTVATRELTLAENTLFLGPVTAERRQQGCVRYSFVPYGSRVPRRHRCQPVLPSGVTPALGAMLTARVRPRFTSLAYGHPAYGQLDAQSPREILRGADDESEMGVYQRLRTPQREDALRIRLDEYLPVGLEAGIFYAT